MGNLLQGENDENQIIDTSSWWLHKEVMKTIGVSIGQKTVEE